MGGLALFAARQLCLSLAFLPPSPQPPSRREGGESRLFHARGCAPCIPATEPARHWLDLPIRHPTGGTAVLLAGLLCHCGSPAGGTMVLVAGRFFTLAVFLPPFPEGEGYPPDPLPGGKGETLGYFMQGAAPLASPRLNPRGTYIPCQAGAQRRGELVFRRKTDRTAFLWAVPPAKERGDRGRGTSAFEMVLSPGAGRTSAAGVQPPPKPLLPIIFRPSLDNRTEVWYTRDTTIETR